MAVQIQLRRDTSAAWTANDPVLLAAELGIETDTGKFKIGDGSTAWSSLPYAADTPTEVAAAVTTAVSGLVDAAPGALDTLNELAAALNDDADFANTVASQLALKSDSADLSAHTSSTTGVHGISDTSLLETQSGAQAKATAAQLAAETYADSLSVNYDPAGSAASAQAAAEGTAGADLAAHNAATTGVHGIADTSLLETTAGAQAKVDIAKAEVESYADSLASNYDAAGSAAAAQTAAEAYADQAQSDAVAAAALDATTKANAAQAAAELYADSLAPNYDPAGSAAAAQAAAESYADTAVSNLVDTAPEALDTLNELAAALGDDPNFATTVSTQIGTKADATDLTAHESATTSVHGIADTSLLETQSGAQAKASAAQSAAETAAQSYTDGAVSALTTDSVPEGASNKYLTDERVQDAAAAMILGGSHTNVLVTYDDAAGTLSIEGASTYGTSSFDSDFTSKTTDNLAEGSTNRYFTDARAVNATAGSYEPKGAALAAQAAAEAYADSLAPNYDPSGAAAAAQAAAETYADGLAPNYDPAGSASAAQTAAEAYADSLAVNYDPAGSAAAAQSAAETYADNAAATAAAAVVDTAPTTLDTLNELAAALGDDPNFATTVATQIGTKADAADLTSHESATTSVHGIADTSALETQTGAQSKADAAQSAAQAYADSLAVNYDATGSAAAAQTAAQTYADGLAANYDPAGSAATAETNANSYTDTAISSFEALPAQTGQSGKYLTTDGAATSWASVPNPALTTYIFTCTDGQTEFSGADDNAATLTFSGSSAAVYLNGVFLIPGADYTTGTNSVTLSSGAASNDVLAVMTLG